jgi:hypothetical protein
VIPVRFRARVERGEGRLVKIKNRIVRTINATSGEEEERKIGGEAILK